MDGLAEADAKQAATEASAVAPTVLAEVADPTSEAGRAGGVASEEKALAGSSSAEPGEPTVDTMAPAAGDSVDGSPVPTVPTATKQNTLYELAGVVVHSGMANAGHYYSFIRVRDPPGAEGPNHGKWFEFNDTLVKPVSMTDAEMETQFFGGKYTPDVGDYYATETDRFWCVTAIYGRPWAFFF